MVAPLAVLQQAAGAISGVVDQIKRLPDAVRGFVDAFNPAAGERLDYAFRSLHATIGYAMEPIIMAATAVVERFAGALMSGMDALRPAIEKVAGLFVGMLQPAMATVGVVMDAVARVAERIADRLGGFAKLFEGFFSVMHVVITTAVTLAEAFIELTSPLGVVNKGFDLIGEALADLAIGFIGLTDFILRFIGATALANKNLEVLAKLRPQSGRAPAPTNFGIGGLEDIYKRRLVEASKGGGKSIEEKNSDFLKRIAEAVEGMKKAMETPEGRRGYDQGYDSGMQAQADPTANTLLKLLRRLRGDQQNER
jgi:hypothetical protein